MKLQLNRIKSDSDTTLGILKINGIVHCGIVEDEYRTKKVWGETRIPSGIYKIGIRNIGNMTKRYASMFLDFHIGMLHILNVPGFENVYMHIGNTDDDTAGCLLTNYGLNFLTMKGNSSKDAYVSLYKQVIKAMLEGEEVELEIIDDDL